MIALALLEQSDSSPSYCVLLELKRAFFFYYKGHAFLIKKACTGKAGIGQFDVEKTILVIVEIAGLNNFFL